MHLSRLQAEKLEIYLKLTPIDVRKMIVYVTYCIFWTVHSPTESSFVFVGFDEARLEMTFDDLKT